MMLSLLFGTSFLITKPQAVYACSGGAPLTVAGLINNSDYVVKARVAELDDEAQNAILRVESYLVGGTSSEFLLLVRNPPTIMDYILAGRSTGADCRGLLSDFQPNDEMYLFLDRNVDGSYEVTTTLFNPYLYTFPDAEATVEVFLTGGYENGGTVYEDVANRDTGEQVTEIQFLEIIAAETNQSPVSPNMESPYPLKAPLRITTAAGTEYILPIDGNPPVELTRELLSTMERDAFIEVMLSDAGRCETEGCRTYSPDRLNVAVQADANTIRFALGNQAAGQSTLFSSASDAVAIWNNCQLTIYSLGYPRLLQEWFAVGEVNHVSLNPDTNCQSFADQAAWSPEGLSLAYTDAEGLWLWDIFTSEAQPRLLISANDTAVIPRYFSPGGRYLAVTQSSRRYTLDTVSGEELPDGVISPDDRLLLSYDTAAEVSSLEICALTPYQCQPAQGMYYFIRNDDGEAVSGSDSLEASQVEWRNSNSFLALACLPDNPTLCNIFQWRPIAYGWYRSLLGSGRAFAYDHSNHSLAIAADRSIEVGGRRYDLAEMLD
ncbi:MAG: hypothetical protein ABI835_11800, partial [Chloroflexota bacterium]